MQNYYLDNNGNKDGPHDLVTIMRRIRAGKITRDTLVHAEGSEPLPAAQIPDIAMFFESAPRTDKTTTARSFTLGKILRQSWQLVTQHHVVTVYAGGMLLLAVMLASGLLNRFGVVTGGIAAWVVFVVFHNLFFVFVLRMYRGQTTGSSFINQHLAPILLNFILMSVVLALMMAGGFMLLVIPGILISVMYIFAPFLMLDRRYNVAQAMYASRLLLAQRGAKYIALIFMLVCAHLLCLVLLIPIPVTLPIFAIALSTIYDEMTAP